MNPLIALVASGSLTAFLWIAVRKSVEAARKRPAHDLERLLGQTGETRTKVQEDGSVFVSGEMWSAKSDNAIPAGSHIRVVRREGFVLVVEKDNSDKNPK